MSLLSKLLKKAGFAEKKHTWDDMSYDIHKEILKRFVVAPIMFIIFFAVSYRTSVWPFMIFGGLFAAISIIVGIYTYMVFAYERYVLFIGEVCNIDKHIRTTKKKTYYGRAVATMRIDDMLVDFPISPNTEIGKGTKCALYAAPNNIIEKGNKRYTIPVPIAISILSQENNELYTMKNKSEQDIV